MTARAAAPVRTVAPIFVPVREAMDRFGFSRATAYRWAEKGAFPIYRRGNIAFLKVEEVVAYLEAASHSLQSPGGKAGGKPAASPSESP